MAVLSEYVTQTQRLLQNPPSASAPLYAQSDIVAYINTARSQLAGESACIRGVGSLSTVVTQRAYTFGGITYPGLTGIGGTFNVRMLTLTVSGGQRFVNTWPWEWFNRYFLCRTGVAPAAPADWSQLGQGVSGTLYLDPVPDGAYALNVDAALYPIDLASDTDVEAIPYPWTDAVPFYAAYYAYMSAQRQSDADKMYARYEEFTARARAIATSAVLPNNAEQNGAAPRQSARGGGQ